MKLGRTWLLDRIWRRLGLDRIINRLLERHEYQSPVERLLFSLVANRALAPSSKLGMEQWVGREVYIQDLPKVDSQQLYRAMDFLMEASQDIEKDVFFEVSNLFNLKVDLVFFDTTSTYFELETEDELRRRGHSKDHRPDRPQVVIGFAVTREGLPVRCWTWPGNTLDQNVIEQVKLDLNSWQLNRVIVVGDTGMNTPVNRLVLQGACGHYILGEKMRLGSKGKAHEAVKRQLLFPFDDNYFYRPTTITNPS